MKEEWYVHLGWLVMVLALLFGTSFLFGIMEKFGLAALLFLFGCILLVYAVIKKRRSSKK